MDSPRARPAIVVNAIIAAVLMTFLSILSAIFSNPVIAIPQAMIAGAAALGLKRGDAWAGFGLALFLSCSTAAAVFAASQIGSLQNPNLIVGAVVPLAVAAFAYLGGRALEGRESSPGVV